MWDEGAEVVVFTQTGGSRSLLHALQPFYEGVGVLRRRPNSCGDEGKVVWLGLIVERT